MLIYIMDNFDITGNAGNLLACLFLMVMIRPVTAEGADMQRLYYVRLDVVSINNVISGSTLEMLPAENEFRIADFTRVRVTGRADPFMEHDIVSSAKHNAVSTLLTHYGLKSINSNHKTINTTTSHDLVTLRYEGLIKLPVAIIDQGYDTDQTAFIMEMECDFSPIPFPDKWSALYLKSLLKLYIGDVVSLFGF